MDKIKDTIAEAIISKTTLKLTVNYLSGKPVEIEFDPYIFGSDTMQFYFVWGYLTLNKLHYKLRFDSIVSAKLTNKKFTIQEDTIYLYSDNEEHYQFVDELVSPIERIFLDGVNPNML